MHLSILYISSTIWTMKCRHTSQTGTHTIFFFKIFNYWSLCSCGFLILIKSKRYRQQNIHMACESRRKLPKCCQLFLDRITWQYIHIYTYAKINSILNSKKKKKSIHVFMMSDLSEISNEILCFCFLNSFNICFVFSFTETKIMVMYMLIWAFFILKFFCFDFC